MKNFTVENIHLEYGLFKNNFTTDIKLKEYKEIILKLKKLNQILVETKIEHKVVAAYLNEKVKEKGKKKLRVKEIKKYTRYARRALRTNLISHLFPNHGVRQLSILISSSHDYQNFILYGDQSKLSVINICNNFIPYSITYNKSIL